MGVEHGHSRSDTSLRVLVISDHYPPHITGGYDTACEAVTEGLRRRGHEVRVLTSVYGASRGDRSEYIDRVLHRPQDSASLPQLGWWELLDHQQLDRVVTSWRPDVVYAWKLLQLFPSIHRWLARRGIPTAFNLQDVWVPAHCDQSVALAAAWDASGSGWIRPAAKVSIRAALRLMNPDVMRPVTVRAVPMDHVVFCSRFRERQHIEAGLGRGQTCVIYNGIDVERFTGRPGQAAGGALKLLFVGRLVAEKGLHTLIDSLACLRREGLLATLTILGIPSYPFEYRERIDAQIAALGLASQITFRPPVATSDMSSVYRAHDVLAFPSIGPEGFPMTLLEAAASGVTIVGTTTGGSGEFLVDDDTGLVFAPGDAEDLARRLATVAGDHTRAIELAASAQRRARVEFGIDRIVAETEAYLARIAA